MLGFHVYFEIILNIYYVSFLLGLSILCVIFKSIFVMQHGSFDIVGSIEIGR